jgi:hypothetical protein
MRQSYSYYRLVNFIKLVVVIDMFLIATFVTLLTKSFNKHREDVIISHHNNTTRLSLISTCSFEADLRGPNQSVISFSLYGDLSDPAISIRYIQPLRALTANISRIYPGNSD